MTGQTSWSEAPLAMMRVEAFAAALEKLTNPRAENWTWPHRPPTAPPTGGPEPTRVAFCQMLEGGPPYYREDPRCPE
jgi:hypothetical protein